MIIHFESPSACDAERDVTPSVRSGGVVSVSSTLFFWRQIRFLAEAKCDALRGSFRAADAEVTTQVDRTPSEREDDAFAAFHGSPGDAA
jgi:hypothetical protein